MNEAEQPNMSGQREPVQSKRPPPWYSLTPWALAVGGLMWAAGVIATGLRAIETLPLEYAVPKTMGALVGALIILMVLYGAAWLFAFIVGRRRVVLSSMFVVLVLCVDGTLLAMSLSDARDRARQERARDALHELSQQNLHNERQRLETGTTEVDLEAFDMSQRAIRDIAASADEQTRVTLEVMQALNQKIREAAVDYNQTQAPLFARPLMDPHWVESADDLHTARMHIEAFAAANDRLRAASTYPGDQIRAEFHDRGVTDEGLIAGAIAGTRQSPGYHAILEIRRTDAELAALLLEVCDLYQSRWGTWEYDHDRQMVLFESHEDVARWMAINEQVVKVAAEQEDWKRRAAGLPPAQAPDSASPANAESEGGRIPDLPPIP